MIAHPVINRRPPSTHAHAYAVRISAHRLFTIRKKSQIARGTSVSHRSNRREASCGMNGSNRRGAHVPGTLQPIHRRALTCYLRPDTGWRPVEDPVARPSMSYPRARASRDPGYSVDGQPDACARDRREQMAQSRGRPRACASKYTRPGDRRVARRKRQGRGEPTGFGGRAPRTPPSSSGGESF